MGKLTDSEIIADLLRKSREKIAAMSPQEYADMIEAQRQSWVRAMTTPCEHGVLDFEQCPDCRRAALSEGEP